MIYPYRCQECSHNFDVVKSVKQIDSLEECQACGSSSTERLFSAQIYFIGAKVEDSEYNPGLGCVTKGKRHREEIAKQRGLVEVGNESADTLHKESVVKKEKQREREWSEL